MERRTFCKTAAQVVAAGTFLPIIGCGDAQEPSSLLGARAFVTLYDTYAMALYMDGSLGPKTGIIKVDYILANQIVPMEFWHGHGGRNHKFVLLPEHFAQLKRMERVYIETDIVQDHKHKLFIDPVDPRWRVPGAQPIQVPVDERQFT